MKNYIRNLALVAGMSGLLGSSVVLAQSENREMASIPFAFHASTSTLAAGRYSVTVLNNLGVVEFRDRATGHSVMIGTRSRQDGYNAAPRLTFHRYGAEYFLSEIWMPGDSTGYKLSPSAREKEAAKEGVGVSLASIRLLGK